MRTPPCRERASLLFRVLSDRGEHAIEAIQIGLRVVRTMEQGADGLESTHATRDATVRHDAPYAPYGSAIWYATDQLNSSYGFPSASVWYARVGSESRMLPRAPLVGPGHAFADCAS